MNCVLRNTPNTSTIRNTTQCGVDGSTAAKLAIMPAHSTPLAASKVRKPNHRSRRDEIVRTARVPTLATKVSMPDVAGLRPKPIWNSSGSMNGTAFTPDAAQSAGQGADAEAADGE